MLSISNRERGNPSPDTTCINIIVSDEGAIVGMSEEGKCTVLQLDHVGDVGRGLHQAPRGAYGEQVV